MKRPLSLLEVVIALALTAILLTSLFSCYRHLVLTKVQLNNVRSSLYPKLFTQARLMQIFDHLEEGNVCYTDEGVLHLRFDNGLDRDPYYCGPINCTLSIKKNHLVLALENQTNNQETRDEYLHKKVKKLDFLFFDPKKLNWVSNWEGSQLPPQVRIVINNEEKITFSVPNMKHEAQYQ